MKYTPIISKCLPLLLAFLGFYSCNERNESNQNRKALELESLSYNTIQNEISIKNISSDTLLLLNVNSSIVSEDGARVNIGYYLSPLTIENNKNRETGELNLSAMFSYPGQVLRLRMNQDHNVSLYGEIKITIGYRKISEGESNRTGITISPDLLNSQLMEGFSIECKTLTKS